ncbi:MAG TPA: hypothetical protein PLG90_08920 [Ignavibacteria bacterium]|nr:hypothetical protein [Ignavibacteria bacterium]
MPRSSMGGDDPLHDLSGDEKDKIEEQLRAEARELRKREKFKDAKKKETRAIEISRRKSNKAQHH